LHQLHAPWLIGTAIIVFGVRLIAMLRNWSAPTAAVLGDQVGG
jgi:hypothetical protein